MPLIATAIPAALPVPQRNWSLFLDFDGTLTRIADRPGDVHVDARLTETLAALTRLLGGAVAVVSGRPLAEIDHFLMPLRVAGAGKHGLECRLPGGGLEAPPGRPASLARVKARLLPAIVADPRLILEDKEQTLALHFRQAPEKEAACRSLVAAALRGEGGREVLEGKMVFEVKPLGNDKGTAIETLMRHPVFAGRVPVFAGDDITDEDGFRAVNAMNGISVRVGCTGRTAAQYSIRDVDAVLAWLDDVKHAIASDRIS
jgi:trehalose 6-phosphate phosphatase